jgi:hypothetical protein
MFTSQIQVLRQQVHQQPVVPARTVGIALISARDPDRPEADQGVAPDRRLVVGGGVDHEPVVMPGSHEIPGERADGIAADSAAVHRWTSGGNTWCRRDDGPASVIAMGVPATEELRLRFSSDAAEFLEVAGGYLAADPVVSTVVATVARRVLERRADGVVAPARDWWLVVANRSGDVVGAGMRTAPFAPYPPFLLPMPDRASVALAHVLYERGEQVLGVNGAPPPSTCSLRRWSASSVAESTWPTTRGSTSCES